MYDGDSGVGVDLENYAAVLAGYRCGGGVGVNGEMGSKKRYKTTTT
jgi:hypothetical protein